MFDLGFKNSMLGFFFFFLNLKKLFFQTLLLLEGVNSFCVKKDIISSNKHICQVLRFWIALTYSTNIRFVNCRNLRLRRVNISIHKKW